MKISIMNFLIFLNLTWQKGTEKEKGGGGVVGYEIYKLAWNTLIFNTSDIIIGTITEINLER